MAAIFAQGLGRGLLFGLGNDGGSFGVMLHGGSFSGIVGAAIEVVRGLRLRVGIGASSKENSYVVGLTVVGGGDERGMPLRVGGVDVGAVGNQFLDSGGYSVLGCFHENSCADVISRFDVGTVADQES